MAIPSFSTMAAPAICWRPAPGMAATPRAPNSRYCASTPKSAAPCSPSSIPSKESAMLHKTLIASLLGLALVGCGQQDPQAKVSAALTDGVLLPAYSSWQEADRQLAANAEAFCAGSADLSAARQAFLGAQSAWAGLQPLLVGPLAEGNRAWQIQFWPDKKNLVQRQVEALLKNKPQLSQADVEKASVVVQGLTAYEYVLFDAAIDLSNPEQKTR